MSNPIAVVRDVNSSPQNGRGVHQIVGRVDGGASKDVTVETGLKTILQALVVNETDGALVVPTIADSTALAGTKKVTFSVANSKSYSYQITGNLMYTETVPSITADTTVTYKPLNG